MPPSNVIARDLLVWYDRHRRDLPWRARPGQTADPYAVWLSEVMLQQTTVTAVKPYYARFLAAWPNVAALAAAPREEILRAWAGLGYYARARNMHECAIAVTTRFAGRFPATEAELRGLPGIGDYTAAAVAAIAFGEPAAVVDGNVERLVTRLFAVDAPLPASKPVVRRLVEGLVPRDRPGDFAQATMDLGATICTPRSPACAICPLTEPCAARASRAQADYPKRSPKRARPQKFGAMAVIERGDGAILVRSRPDAGLLGGMTEFLGTAWTGQAPDLAPLRNVADVSFRPAGTVEHSFTHFDLRLAVFAGTGTGATTPAGYRWALPDQLEREPIPTLMAKVLDTARRGGT